MRNYIIYSIICMSCFLDTTQAQQDAISNHYWVTPSLHNPALIGIFNENTINISASMLDYWVMIPNAPKSFQAVVEIPIPTRNIGIGAFFRQEEYFLFKESTGSVSFNYKFPISEHSEFRAGLGLGFWENRINFSGVSIKDLDDGLILDGAQGQMAFQFSFSLAYRFKQFCIGTTLPYMITNKNSTINSVSYGNHNLDSTSFNKPLLFSFYASQSVLPKKISRDTHALDIVALFNMDPIFRRMPFDTRLSFLYRFGGFVKSKDNKKMAAKVLSLDAVKVGLGYRFAWKNNETKERMGHGGHIMAGLEIGQFLELDYVMGINNSITTLGVTHEVICKIRITKRKKSTPKNITANYSNEIEDLSYELAMVREQIDSITSLYDSLKIDTEVILQETVPLLESQIEDLKLELETLEKQSTTNKAILESEIRKLEENLEKWKQIVGGKQDVDIEIKTPPNSKVNK